MSCKKNHNSDSKEYKIIISQENNKDDVVDRFLKILWRREADMKLTFK